MVQEPIPSASFVRFASELEVSKAPNTTLSAMLMIYLFLTRALCLELRGRWEREIIRASSLLMAD